MDTHWIVGGDVLVRDVNTHDLVLFNHFRAAVSALSNSRQSKKCYIIRFRASYINFLRSGLVDRAVFGYQAKVFIVLSVKSSSSRALKGVSPTEK